MIMETLTLLAKAMDNSISQKVAVGDLARQPSPPNKILLTLLSQEILNRNEAPSLGATPAPQRVRLTVIAGCYFGDYGKALAAFDAAWAFAHNSPHLRRAPDDEPTMIHVLWPAASELAAYWSVLRMPIVPSLFLQLDALWSQSTADPRELPILEPGKPS